MGKNASLYPEDWYRIGSKELKRAEILLQHKDVEGAAFNVQQTIEKYFKGFLLSKGWELRKVHNLETLLNDVVEYDPSFEEFRDECLKVTDYYFEDRYPFTAVSGLTEEEVKQSLVIARRIIEKILL